MTDRNEALRLADAIDPFTRTKCPDHLTSKVAADALRQQADRIAELEAERIKRHQRLHDTEELAGQYLAQRDDATAQRDQLRAEVERLRQIALRQSVILGEYSKSLHEDDFDMEEIVSLGREIEAIYAPERLGGAA